MPCCTSEAVYRQTEKRASIALCTAGCRLRPFARREPGWVDWERLSVRCGAGEAAVHHPLVYAHPRAPARLGVCLGKTSGLLRDRGTAQAMHFHIYVCIHLCGCTRLCMCTYSVMDIDG